MYMKLGEIDLPNSQSIARAGTCVHSSKPDIEVTAVTGEPFRCRFVPGTVAVLLFFFLGPPRLLGK